MQVWGGLIILRGITDDELGPSRLCQYIAVAFRGGKDITMSSTPWWVNALGNDWLSLVRAIDVSAMRSGLVRDGRAESLGLSFLGLYKSGDVLL